VMGNKELFIYFLVLDLVNWRKHFYEAGPDVSIYKRAGKLYYHTYIIVVLQWSIFDN